MSTAFGQVWEANRYSDTEIILSQLTTTSTPSGWTLVFVIGPEPFPTNPGSTIPTATLSITPTVSGDTITVPITKAQSTSVLVKDSYEAALWRTDSGSKKPLATGTLNVVTVPTPQ